ncbi:hypothetical protein FRC11_014685, partial [Ceratobasidium sp. 423]
MAGTGKTTIAYSLCDKLETNGRLGASFFCSPSYPASRDVSRIIPTVAYQLAQLSCPFQWSLCKILETISDVSKLNMREQFETLVVGPFLEVKDLLPSGMVIVIDALDECLDTGATKLVLDTLLSQANSLPIRFFLTSHIDNFVFRIISSQTSGALSIISLDTAEEKSFNGSGLEITDGLRDDDVQYSLRMSQGGETVDFPIAIGGGGTTSLTTPRELDGIEQKMKHLFYALSLTSDDHPFLPFLLSCLGVSYEKRFDLLGEPDDNEKAIEFTSIALTLTLNGDPGLPGLLNTLLKSHNMRFNRLGDAGDIEKLIEYAHLALDITPDGHPDLPPRLFNLGVSHSCRFKRLGELGDLEKAIEYETRAIALAPNDHPDLLSWHACLGESY